MKLILSVLFAVSILALGAVQLNTSYAEVTIIPADGSGSPGCETTSDGCFLPSVVNVDVGEKIIFTNTDSAAHTFTAGTGDSGPTGEFDTGLLMSQNSYEYTPNSAGQIDYLCMVHPWMIGTIIIGEGTGPDDNDNDNTTTPPADTTDDSLEIENQQLRTEIQDLKAQISTLETEIEQLEDQILAMTSEFTQMISQLNEWFRTQLDSP